MDDLRDVLRKIYDPLIGQKFAATYDGKWNQRRDVLIVNNPKVEQILEQILKDMESTKYSATQTLDDVVWKGIIDYRKTGEYHLYILPMKELDGITHGKSFTFKVKDISFFSGLDWIVGVNIGLAKI